MIDRDESKDMACQHKIIGDFCLILNLSGYGTFFLKVYHNNVVIMNERYLNEYDAYAVFEALDKMASSLTKE